MNFAPIVALLFLFAIYLNIITLEVGNERQLWSLGISALVLYIQLSEMYYWAPVLYFFTNSFSLFALTTIFTVEEYYRARATDTIPVSQQFYFMSLMLNIVTVCWYLFTPPEDIEEDNDEHISKMELKSIQV